MAANEIEKAIVWEDGGATCMARVTGQDAANITKASITSIGYSAFDSEATGAAVDTAALTVASVVFDSLQTDARWTKDAPGYNFRHEVPASALTTGNHTYIIEYMFTPATGEVFWVLFSLRAQAVRTS